MNMMFIHAHCAVYPYNDMISYVSVSRIYSCNYENLFISSLFMVPISRSGAHGFANEVAERLPRQDLVPKEP